MRLANACRKLVRAGALACKRPSVHIFRTVHIARMCMRIPACAHMCELRDLGRAHAETQF